MQRLLFGILLLGAAGVLVHHEGICRWLGWTDLILGVGLCVPFGVGLVAAAVTVIWVATVSIVFTIRGQSGATEVTVA